jgi:hypothetical protein
VVQKMVRSRTAPLCCCLCFCVVLAAFAFAPPLLVLRYTFCAWFAGGKEAEDDDLLSLMDSAK